MSVSISSLLPTNEYYKTTPEVRPLSNIGQQDFAGALDSAKKLLLETNRLEQQAENESTKFLIGEADNAHDVMIAAQKAQIALQYTNAIRTNVLQSYQTIMQMQI